MRVLPPRVELERQVLGRLSEATDQRLEDDGLSLPVGSLGLSSAAILELLIELEDVYGVVLRDEDLRLVTDVSSFLDLVEASA